MTLGDTTVTQLVLRVLDTGCTPEVACRDSPDLLAQVREQLRLIQLLDAEVESVFPPSDSALLDDAIVARSVESLPHVPGHEVLSLLGHGGMGVVYAARHLRLNRTVAVKMLLQGAHTDAVGLKRLVREAEAVAALDHPNIVQVHEVGEHEGLPYFTMELVEGGSLREKIERHILFPREAASIVASLAEAIAVAHESGIVHRDLKPANVLLTRDDVPKIVDFGLARWIDGDSSLTETGANLGTPSYMSPEQALGGSHAVGPATDVYALGAILYATLTGRPPFRSNMSVATIRQVIEDEPVRPSRLVARLPRDLETICLKCLSKDPIRRYVTASALAEDLQRFLRGEPIIARPAGFLERVLKWVRRRPAHATIVAGALLALLALAGAGLSVRLQRNAVARATEQDLVELDRAARDEDWPAARAALETARARLMGGGFADLTTRVEQGVRELAVAERLDSIREQHVVLESEQFGLVPAVSRADAAYEAVFRELVIAIDLETPEDAAARIRGSRIRTVLVSALDTWAIHVVRDVARRDWLLETARLADPDPASWRNRVRDPDAWVDEATLAELASSAPVSVESLTLLLTLVEHLIRAGADAVPYLERIQQEHPDDYWVNATLGSQLARHTPSAAVRYFQAAAAVRPGSAVARRNLGIVLVTSGRIEEGTAHFRKAIAIDPADARSHVALSTCLQWVDEFAEAVEELLTAARVDRVVTLALLEPTSVDLKHALEIDSRAHTYESLGHLLLAKGELDDALTCLRAAVRLDPRRPPPRGTLVKALIARGRFEEARSEARLFVDGQSAEDPERKGAQVLLAHAERLVALEAELPAILDGTRIPHDGAECLALADLFRARQDHAQAVLYFTDAFERGVGTPVRDANWRTADAARCAALAATGGGGARDIPSDEERAALRAAAYTWLGTELGGLNAVLEDDAHKYARFALRSLQLWRLDHAFVGVRDDAALERLPEVERMKWQKFWSAAGTLTARARKAL
jgi:tetratricopeptide (TPR) repeat protein